MSLRNELFDAAQKVKITKLDAEYEQIIEQLRKEADGGQFGTFIPSSLDSYIVAKLEQEDLEVEYDDERSQPGYRIYWPTKKEKRSRNE